ncbi:MAG TPA: bifunctional methylenetetrahydrofolate dehydrogenase/methenyltetrahydrofolate cyclohydrolase [Rhodobiaceae bacterium]|uniref:Bifunctional protein FolD n=1 Tax=PS1 clade bacterium TaxID=2175152 RepID=A0A368EE13_9PROT|nr:MAG: bifunctional methylenetetrahydrofolate dehydrogenase/methenyltetrahydrofolate cyclohydrolase [PS1 clade bacterium]HCN32551.1 bifunctional methylenetetrahydrofolate dehydrogenase/methenyltetrahydrofolate cyclohydrolase [Rhodobiaceae bacterium]
MPAAVIDGKEIAANLRARIGTGVADLQATHNLTPGLAVVLVGEDPASQVYVRNKGIATKAAGMTSFEYRLDKDVSEADLLAKVNELNEDDAVHGILVQFPVPPQISQQTIIETILSSKDVDGLNPINAGLLASGLDALTPCTPQGSVILAKQTLGNLEGLHAVIVGRSNIVGKPVAQLLLQENCTVTMAHSRTRDLAGLCKTADILVAAVGIPEMIKADWVKPGACVIDVGINRIDASERGEGKTRLVGDVDFEAVAEIAGHITPVPGGVGPMTIACLLKNTLDAACAQAGIEKINL